MPFTKGDKNINRSGRKKGSQNKLSIEIRQKLEDILNKTTDDVLSDLQALSPKDRVRAYTELLKYVVAVKKDVEITDTAHEGIRQFLELTDDQIKKLYDID